ncbi:MAG: DUF6600 domain-containing protein [Verrucomicrobiia bacterium]
MNGTKRLAGKVGFVLCTALLGTLTAHTTYAAEVVVVAPVVVIHTDSDFYEPLSPYGRWEVVGSYGRCWIPNGVDADWGPYSNGYWEQTDAGWYWVSDEPWAWATYHYGGWDYNSQFGWYWVPQTQWAPAWVSWREGGGYVGWSPLRPSARFWGRGVAPRGTVFVEESHFLQPVSRKTIIVNTTITSKTVINKKGPDTAVIEKASGRKLQAVPVRELRTKEEAKVVAKHPTPTPTSEKAVQTPVRSQAEKALPASEPRPVAKPPVTTAAPQPPSTQKEVHPADVPTPVTKPAEEKRAQQEKARETESAKGKPAPAAVEAKPETKPEIKHEAPPEAKIESRPAAERPAATREPTQQREGKGDEKKD